MRSAAAWVCFVCQEQISVEEECRLSSRRQRRRRGGGGSRDCSGEPFKCVRSRPEFETLTQVFLKYTFDIQLDTLHKFRRATTGVVQVYHSLNENTCFYVGFVKLTPYIS